MERQLTRHARATITIVFAVHGMVAGSFGSRSPWLIDHLGLSAGQFGIALLCPALGAFVGMPTVARVVHRLGGRAATRLLIVLWCAAGTIPILMPNLPALCVALFLFGVAAGTSDVAMNAQGVLIERGLGKPIMSSLHGAWAAGNLTGAGIGAAVSYAHVDARVHLVGIAALLVLGMVAVTARLPEFPTAETEVKPPRFTLPAKGILVIGLVGFCGAFIEGVCHSWTTVYVAQVTTAAAGTAAVAYGVFSGTLALTRLGGDAVVRRFGPTRTVRAGAVVAVAGAVTVVLSRSPLPAIAGFALLALGVAVIVPLAVSSGGRAAAVPSQGIAGVTTMTYLSSLAAPAAIGGTANLTSLPTAFLMLAGIAAVMFALAGRLRTPAHTEAALAA